MVVDWSGDELLVVSDLWGGNELTAVAKETTVHKTSVEETAVDESTVDDTGTAEETMAGNETTMGGDKTAVNQVLRKA